MLLTRVFSAIVLIPLVVAAVLIGDWALVALLAVMLGLASGEFVRLMQQGGYRPAWLVAYVLVATLLLDSTGVEARLMITVVSLTLIGSLVWHMGHRTATVTADWALSVAMGLYLGWAGRQFVAIRAFDDGAAWLVLVLTGTWLADSGAYFVGSRAGHHKMAPTLSPKKSWEGLAGGIAAGVAGNGLLAAVFGLPPIHGAALGLLGATIGTLGDLSISMMKRQVGVKDSSQLIPGHGGALDRVDSLLFSVVAGYLYLTWFTGMPTA